MAKETYAWMANGERPRKCQESTFAGRKQQNSFKKMKLNKELDKLNENKSLLGDFQLPFIAAVVLSGLLIGSGIASIVADYTSNIGRLALFLGSSLAVSLSIYFISIQHRGALSLVLHSKKIDDSSNASSSRFYHVYPDDFPPDPVLERAMTDLIYHGQEDCNLCRKMRRADIDSNLNPDLSHPTIVLRSKPNFIIEQPLGDTPVTSRTASPRFNTPDNPYWVKQTVGF